MFAVAILNWLRWLDSNQRFLAYETKRMTTSIHRDIGLHTTCPIILRV